MGISVTRTEDFMLKPIFQKIVIQESASNQSTILAAPDPPDFDFRIA